jgi:hypothetical protein
LLLVIVTLFYKSVGTPGKVIITAPFPSSDNMESPIKFVA